jgi:hypothetical protein
VTEEFDPLNAEERAAIFGGLSVRELASLFNMPYQTVHKRIAVVEPAGQRNGGPVYRIPDVAPYLVKPAFDLNDYIRKLKPKDLPAALQKNFWDAQKARQSYELEAGNLWHTSRVQDVIIKLMVIFRQQVTLATDNVDRLAPLSNDQRTLVQGLFDQVISDMQTEVTKAFADYTGKGDRQDLYEEGPPAQIIAMIDEEEDIDLSGLISEQVDDGLSEGL